MPEKPAPPKKLSEKSTKQEMLDAYQSLAKELEGKRASELNPEKRLAEKKSEEAVKVAEPLSPIGIDREIGNLRADIGKLLVDISEKLAAETAKFKSVQQAVESKQREIQELYGIEKSAVSLAALIEAQNQKRRDFEVELAAQKEELVRDIESTRSEWEREKKTHEAEIRERDTTEKKARDREKEESAYLFKREQQSIKDKLNDEKATLEKELQRKREAAEKEFSEREKAVVEKERELSQLRERTTAFPTEQEAAVDRAVKEISEKLKADAKNREDLLRKESEGERNVLTTRIESLEKTTKDYNDQIAKLSRQLESAYQKVQDIAEKAIEGASHSKTLAELQKLLAEQSRKPAGEKAQ